MTDAQSFNNQLKEFLKSTVVDNIAPPLSSLVFLNASQTIYQALKTLAKHKISSAPVLDSDGIATGMCSVLDILVFVVKGLDEEENSVEGKNVFELMAKGSKFSHQKVSDLLDKQTKVDSYIVIQENSNLKDVLKHFSDGVHRCPIISSDSKKLKSLLTQSAIVKSIAEQASTLFPKHGEVPIKDLNIGATPVISAEMDEPAMSAFKKMVQTNVAGIAIVDDNGAILGNLSARDLATCESKNLYHAMHQDTRAFLQKMRSSAINIQNPAIAVSESTPLKLVLLKLAGNGIHRIYVCDKDQRPTRVISLRDILEFAHELSNE